MARLKALPLLVAAPLLLSGCLVRTAVDVTGAAVGAVVPDGKKDKKKKDDKDDD